MPKQSGLGDNFYAGGRDLSGDIGSIGSIAGPMATQDVTGLNKSGRERVALLGDAAFEYTAYFNPDPGRAHEYLASLPTADQVVTYCRGTALGSPAALVVAKQIDYAPSRGADGALTIGVSGQGAAGWPLRWGQQLTAGRRVDTAATQGTALDFGVGGTRGAHAALHVFAFTGTDVTVRVQSSTDNGVGDAWADVPGLVFGPVTSGPTALYLTTAANAVIERYLRVVTTTTGGFTNLDFAVALSRGAELAP